MVFKKAITTEYDIMSISISNSGDDTAFAIGDADMIILIDQL